MINMNIDNIKFCWNCEIVEIEADESFCSIECRKESQKVSY
jgi:predicted nucleic acid-binding Zn ribbon protein